MAGGDGIQQGIEHHATTPAGCSFKTYANRFRHNFDSRRLAKMGGYGLFVVGPLMHNWFKVLELLVTQSGPTGAVMKVCVDQMFMAPLSTALFFTVMGLVDGNNLSQIQSKLGKVFWPTLMVNYKIWPAVQFLNFFFVPTSFRLLFVNVVGLGYNAFLSSVMAGSRKSLASSSPSSSPIPPASSNGNNVSLEMSGTSPHSLTDGLVHHKHHHHDDQET